MTASNDPNQPDLGEKQAYGLVLGQVIARLREQKGGMTQAQLAGRLGISQSALSKIEAGKRPDAYLFGQIARAFDLEVQQLEAQVQDAMQRAKRAAAAVTDKKPNSGWGEFLALAGFIGIIAFVVAAVVSEGGKPGAPKPPAPG